MQFGLGEFTLLVVPNTYEKAVQYFRVSLNWNSSVNTVCLLELSRYDYSHRCTNETRSMWKYDQNYRSLCWAISVSSCAKVNLLRKLSDDWTWRLDSPSGHKALKTSYTWNTKNASILGFMFFPRLFNFRDGTISWLRIFPEFIRELLLSAQVTLSVTLSFSFHFLLLQPLTLQWLALS